MRLASFPGSPLAPTKNKNRGGEPCIDLWHLGMRLLSFGTTKVYRLGKGEYKTKSVATKRTYCFDNNDCHDVSIHVRAVLIISAIIMLLTFVHSDKCMHTKINAYQVVLITCSIFGFVGR